MSSAAEWLQDEDCDADLFRCPECRAVAACILGHEVRGVYDGVLFWECLNCGHVWNRWDEAMNPGRFRQAEEQIALHRASDGIARDRARGMGGES